MWSRCNGPRLSKPRNDADRLTAEASFRQGSCFRSGAIHVSHEKISLRRKSTNSTYGATVRYRSTTRRRAGMRLGEGGGGNLRCVCGVPPQSWPGHGPLTNRLRRSARQAAGPISQTRCAIVVGRRFRELAGVVVLRMTASLDGRRLETIERPKRRAGDFKEIECGNEPISCLQVACEGELEVC